MKGILLAGGSGTRLLPVTKAVNKHLLAVYDRPLVYFPLTSLMLSGIREILIISTPQALPQIGELLGDGTQWGLRLTYSPQDHPRGVADAIRIGRQFIGHVPICLALGDNIFCGRGLRQLLRRSAGGNLRGARVFASRVKSPEHYGIVSFDGNGRPTALEEKPEKPSSDYAVAGLYFYDGRVTEFADQVEPSVRGELEITDINRMYLERGLLDVKTLGHALKWWDVGTPDALLEAGRMVAILEAHGGVQIGCPEEVAFREGFIDRERFRAAVQSCALSDYGQRLRCRATAIENEIARVGEG